MSLTAEPIEAVIPTMPIEPVGDQVIIWSKPRCVQCTATYRALDDKGIDYIVEALDENPEAIQALRNANILQAPFVQTATDAWTGFRPDKINEIAAAIA